MRELHVRHPLTLHSCRNVDRDEQILLPERGRHHALEETVRIDGAASTRSRDGEARVQSREDGRQIGRRVGVRDIAADRAAVPDGRVADLRRRFRKRRAVLPECGGRGQFGVRRQRADPHRAVSDRNALELGDPADVDERRRRRQPQLQQRDEAVPAGQELGPGIFFQEIACFGNRSGPVVVEICCVHGQLLSWYTGQLLSCCCCCRAWRIPRHTRSAVIGI